MIDKANEKARSVQLNSERKREEAKRELKDKLKSVEVELQHLTEKITSSGLMEESGKPTYSRMKHYKPIQAINRNGATKKISGNKWQRIPAELIPTAVYELSAIGIPQTYMSTSCSRQMPQFSYNAYPLAVLPQSKCNKANSRFQPETLQSASRLPTLHDQRSNNSERYESRIPASKIRPAYAHVDENVAVNNTFPTSHTTKESSNHVEYPTNPPIYCYISDENVSNARCGLVNKKVNDERGCNYDMINNGLRINQNPTGARFESSRGGATSCEKCDGFNKQRLVDQQREVYNEFAKARDRAAISKPCVGQLNYAARHDGTITERLRNEALIGNRNVKDRNETEAICNCNEFDGKSASTRYGE